MGERRVDVAVEEEKMDDTSQGRKAQQRSPRDSHVDAATDIEIFRLSQTLIPRPYNVQACLPCNLRIFTSEASHYLCPIEQAMHHDRKQCSPSRPR